VVNLARFGAPSCRGMFQLLANQARGLAAKCLLPRQQCFYRHGNPRRIEPLISHLLPLATATFLVGPDLAIFRFESGLQ
jgi:hypothetical protein